MVVASLIPLSFKIILKFYSSLNKKKKKRVVSLPSLVLLPTFPPSWLLLRSQVLCHPAGKASDCFDFPSPSSPALLGFFERLYLSAPMNGRSPERIIRGENIYILGENLLLHSFPMGRNGLCLVSAMVNHVGCLNQSILQAACV